MWKWKVSVSCGTLGWWEWVDNVVYYLVRARISIDSVGWISTITITIRRCEFEVVRDLMGD